MAKGEGRTFTVNTNKDPQTLVEEARPARRQSSADSHSELIHAQVAFWRPMSCGKVKLLAASGATPRLVNGHFNRAAEDMNTRSA